MEQETIGNASHDFYLDEVSLQKESQNQFLRGVTVAPEDWTQTNQTNENI